MVLPKVATPKYSLKLPSNGKTIKYRPFLVKEEKILLMAVESEDEKEISNAVKEIIKNCIDDDDVNIDDLAVFDVEYLFLNLRSKSVGESVKLKIPCKNCENECNITINLSEVNVEQVEGHTNKIQLNDEIGIIMKYPNFGITEIDNIANDPLRVVNFCVDQIYDSKSVYHAKDSTEEELTEFIESLNQEQFKKIQDFFETMPKIKKEVKYVCPKCEKEGNMVIEKLQDFFT
tara:strand:- start:414 stop:1109 length:696 start_codon:yes stop_codon:yes gene_type:complete